ncbi:hypothetical protein HNR37_002134 [Desulfurispira natronophila]|uniref:Uncharacterized protein n=1 Tax=Desulfurispira natronophila TaxID=682562 RepID=A0A7W7Y633_9BACT|nr:hypothetical protein [Desulfurispira natronophila]
MKGMTESRGLAYFATVSKSQTGSLTVINKGKFDNFWATSFPSVNGQFFFYPVLANKIDPPIRSTIQFFLQSITLSPQITVVQSKIRRQLASVAQKLQQPLLVFLS